MRLYCYGREDVAQCVDAILPTLTPGSQLTMTISRERYGAYCVQTVTDTSSEDTDLQTAKFFSDTQVNI